MKPEKIRVSLGSAVKLGLKRLRVDVQPTNCHLLTYNSEGCEGNCAFCPQSKYTFEVLKERPDSQEFLSRVEWPAFDLDEVLNIYREKFPKFNPKSNGLQRICLQSLNYPGFKEEVLEIVKKIKEATNIPISIAIPPVPVEYIKRYKDIGVERICFALDTATEHLFDEIKGKNNSGPYQWNEHLMLLDEAIKIFGRGYVSTHLIIGFGETELEALTFIKNMKERGILPGIFAFFPIKNTKLENRERPSIEKFRKIQLGKFLMSTGKRHLSDFNFNEEGTLNSFNIDTKLLKDIIDLSSPFQTSGCPGCNRPYYTSSPREEQYNFPRPLNNQEKNKIFEELNIYCSLNK